MAYYDIALLSADNDFIQRIQACAATEGEPDPRQFSSDHIWEIAATPEFGEKYSYALQTGVPNPGRDPAVISDIEILSSVQAIPA